jgi:hypothetical protein
MGTRPRVPRLLSALPEQIANMIPRVEDQVWDFANVGWQMNLLSLNYLQFKIMQPVRNRVRPRQKPSGWNLQITRGLSPMENRHRASGIGVRNHLAARGEQASQGCLCCRVGSLVKQRAYRHGPFPCRLPADPLDVFLQAPVWLAQQLPVSKGSPQLDSFVRH